MNIDGIIFISLIKKLIPELGNWGRSRGWNERDSSLFFWRKISEKTRSSFHNKEGAVKTGSGGNKPLFFMNRYEITSGF
jgi:hypothetical protein